MTREEAIKFGNLIITLAKFDNDKYNKHTEEFTELAVKALENQKSIIEELENIKVEIENVTPYENAFRLKDDIYKIIDRKLSELKGENRWQILKKF